MSGSAVSEETFEREVLASERPVIVDFWAPWCGPCLALAPVLDQIAAERTGELTVVTVNVDEEPALAVRFGVSSIPTIVLFEGGVPVAGTAGTRGKAHLERALGLSPRQASSSARSSGRLRGLLSRTGQSDRTRDVESPRARRVSNRAETVKRVLILSASAAAVVVAVALGVILLSSSSDSERTTGAAPSEPEVPGAGELDFSTAGWSTDFARHSVPLGEFSSGGPGKDGIPAIDAPRFVSASDADFLEAREPVIQLELNGDVRAYPLQILVWHEIVNDTVGGKPVAVTFCPLCNTTIVFERRLDGRVLDFGTTGNLRNSDLVMYDRQTESWWQQFGGAAVVGELTGKKLRQLPASIVAWEDFERAHPDGRVLSRDTGHSRSYGENPYAGYDSVDSPPFFPAENLADDRLPPKERVVFIEREGEQLVVPFSALVAAKTIEVEVGGEELEVSWRPGTRSALDSGAIASGRDVGTALVRDRKTGALVVFDLPFWFAVAAFAPDAEIVRG